MSEHQIKPKVANANQAFIHGLMHFNFHSERNNLSWLEDNWYQGEGVNLVFMLNSITSELN